MDDKIKPTKLNHKQYKLNSKQSKLNPKQSKLNHKQQRFLYDFVSLALVVLIIGIIVLQAVRINTLTETNGQLSNKCNKQQIKLDEYLLETNEKDDYIAVIENDNKNLTNQIKEKNKQISEYEEEINTLKKQKKDSSKVSTSTKAAAHTADQTKLQKDVEGREYYIVKARITSYCSCAKCCGRWASNRPKDENGNDIVYTASGKRAVPKYTLGASSAYKFGTKVEVPGVGICEVMDRGSGVKSAAHFDMYFSSHSEALKWHNAIYECKVYI